MKIKYVVWSIVPRLQMCYWHEDKKACERYIEEHKKKNNNVEYEIRKLKTKA